MVIQITDLDSEYNDYIDNDTIVALNDLFGQLGISKYENRPYEFYNNNGIKVDKVKHLFLKTKYEEFSDYLICVAWEFRCALKESRKRDTKLELYLNNMLMLKYLRKQFTNNRPIEKSNSAKSPKKITLTLSNSTKVNPRTDDEGLVKIVYEYLEKSISNICLVLDSKEHAKKYTTIYSDLEEIELHENKFIEKNKDDYNIIKDVELEKRIKVISKSIKNFGASLKTKDIGEFIEILMFLGAFRKSKRLNPKLFNDFNPEHYNIIFDYLSYTGILDLIFYEQGKKLKDLKSSPYNYIRSIINNTRNRRTKATIN